MKCAIYYGPKDIRIEDVPYPKVTTDGVILKINACGICNFAEMFSWKNTVQMKRGNPIGHEYSGEVVEIGSNVTGVEVGDRIYQLPFVPCHQCQACRVGDHWRCSNMIEMYERGFAEYMLIPYFFNGGHIKAPKALSSRDLILIEPLELSIGLGNKAREGDTVVIIGQDTVGLGLTVYLKEKNMSKIITCSVSKKRQQASEEAGADVVVDGSKDDLVKVVMQETRFTGADLVVVFDERPLALQQAMGLVRRGGSIWLTQGGYFVLNPDIVSMKQAGPGFIGPDSFYHDQAMTPDPRMFNMQIAWGTLGARLPRWEKAVRLLETGKVNAEKWITHVFPLEKINEAFEKASDPFDSIKVVVEP